MSPDLRGDPLHESTETEKYQNGNQKKYEEIYRMNCVIDWIQEF